MSRSLDLFDPSLCWAELAFSGRVFAAGLNQCGNIDFLKKKFQMFILKKKETELGGLRAKCMMLMQMTKDKGEEGKREGAGRRRMGAKEERENWRVNT